MKIKTDILVTLFANLMLAFSQWILIAGLNYSNNLDVVGQYSYALALAGLFLTIGQTGLRQFLLSKSINAKEIQQLYVTRLYTSALAFLLLLLYAFYFAEALSTWVILLIGLAKMVENISDLAHGFYQRNFQVEDIVRSRIARSIITPFAFLSVFFVSMSLQYACIAMIVSWSIVYVVYDKKAFRQEQFDLRKVHLVPTILKKSYPLGVTSVLVLLSVSLPLFILAELSDDFQVGQYASIFYFVTAGSLILQSALQVVSPIIVKYLSESAFDKVNKVTINCYLFAVGYGLLGIVFSVYIGEYILLLVYGQSYLGLGELMILAALINLALAIQAVGGIVLTAHGVFRFQMIIMALSILVSGLGGYYFILSYGVSGAFIAGALTAAFNSVCFGFKVIQEFRKNEKKTCTAYYK